MSDVDEDDLDDTQLSVRKRTPYNKGACRQCGIAKTKCIPIPGNQRCERCEKLNRECTPRAPSQRKRRTAPATTTRVANLEQKLDSIVNLLSTNKEPSTEQVTPSTVAASSGEQDRTSPEVPSPYEVSNNGHDLHASGSYNLAPSNHTCGIKSGVPLSEATPYRDAIRAGTTHHSSATSDWPREIEFQDGEVDNLLRYFQQCCTTYFPFVLVPAGTSFLQAHKKLPFLFDVISFITSAQNFKRQATLGEKILEDIVNKLLLKPEKTEELLSGMLLFTTWNHIMFPINGQMTSMLHMMKSLIVNLQYDRPPGSINRRLLFMKGYVNTQIRQMAADATPRSPSEQRAVLGCFYLTSIKCMLSGSLPMDHFEFYPYLQECVNSLEETKDQPSDVVLAHMIRLQTVVDRINKALPRGDNPGLVRTESCTPTYMTMKVLQVELAEHRRAWPEQLKNNTPLNLQHLAGEVFLYETVMIDYLRVKSPMDKLQTLEMLNNCLVSVDAYLTLYHQIPHSHYPYFPFTVWMQCGLVLQAAVELAFFDHPGWDLNYVRRSLDIIGRLDREMSGIQSVVNMRRTTSEGVEERDIFQRFLRRKQNMKNAYEQRITAEQQQSTSNNQDGAAVQDWGAMAAGAFPSMEDIYMGGLQYDLETAFWQDFGIGTDAWASGTNGMPTSGPYMGQ